MKFCMMSYTMARRPDLFSVKGMLDLTCELGLEGIDFVTLHDTPAAELKRLADDYGLTVACHTFMADLTSSDASERQPGIDAVKQGIENAVILGTDRVMIPTPGKMGQPREVTRRNIIAALQSVAEFAQQAGVTLTVENFPGANSPFVIADDVLEAIREVPGMGLTFDNGNVFTGGEDPAQSFQRCATHVVHAHFKDWHLADENTGFLCLDGRYYRGGLIGEGIVDQVSCLKAMQQAGYQDFINIEYEGNLYTPAEATRKALEYLREQLAALTA